MFSRKMICRWCDDEDQPTNADSWSVIYDNIEDMDMETQMLIFEQCI